MSGLVLPWAMVMTAGLVEHILCMPVIMVQILQALMLVGMVSPSAVWYTSWLTEGNYDLRLDVG